MATLYWDPVNGVDANDGLSFANRVLTLTTGLSAARIAPGDTIRVIGSPGPTSLAQNATWTDGSRTVTLTSAVTSEINPGTASWSVGINASSTTSTTRKLGSTSSSLTVASGFTTGKSHYKTTTNTDYSAYEQITFWIMQTSGTLASADAEITLKLCSDTAGATPVNTFDIPRIRALNVWQAYTIDNGAALGSSIQSIGFYINSDRGAQTFLINNIQAVKASTADDSLSLTSLISKNSGTEGWFSVDSISGTSVVLRTAGQYGLGSAGTPAGYSGVTESVTLYKRQPLIMPSSRVGTASTTNSNIVQDDGTSGSPITFSGGWNSTDMSTQTGDTYIDGVNGFGRFITVNPHSYLTFDKLNPFNFGTGFLFNSASSDIILTAKDISCNQYTNINVWNSGNGGLGMFNSTITVDNANCCGNSTTDYASGFGASVSFMRACKNINATFINVNSNFNYGFMFSSNGNTTSNWQNSHLNVSSTNVNRNGTYGVTSTDLFQSTLTVNTMSYNSTAGMRFDTGFSTTFAPGSAENNIYITTGISNSANGIILSGAVNNVFYLNGATISNNSVCGINQTYGSSGNIFYGGTLSSNTTADISHEGGLLTMSGSTLNSTTKYILQETGLSHIAFQNYQATANDHRHYYHHGTVLTDATTRHTASGVSWKISPTTVYASSFAPIILPLAKVACNASALVTATVWVYRTNTGITASFVCKGGRVAGISSDVSTTASGSASTWEQLTITFTPTEVGVVDLELQVYGGTTYSVYVDDIAVTQA